MKSVYEQDIFNFLFDCLVFLYPYDGNKEAVLEELKENKEPTGKFHENQKLLWINYCMDEYGLLPIEIKKAGEIKNGTETK